MRQILARYVGKHIGMNYSVPLTYELAMVHEVSDTHITIGRPEVVLHHFPFTAVLRVSEAPEGYAVLGAKGDKVKVTCLVSVQHLVVPKASGGGPAVGFGVGVSFWDG